MAAMVSASNLLIFTPLTRYSLAAEGRRLRSGAAHKKDNIGLGAIALRGRSPVLRIFENTPGSTLPNGRKSSAQQGRLQRRDRRIASEAGQNHLIQHRLRP